MSIIWRPDTCECILEYNGSNEPANFIKAFAQCPFHAGDAQGQTAHGENVFKNVAVTKVVETVTKLKPEDVEWSYDAQRKLKLVIPGINATEKTAIETEMAKLGTVDVETK